MPGRTVTEIVTDKPVSSAALGRREATGRGVAHLAQASDERAFDRPQQWHRVNSRLW
jgi:glutamate dehydrogenase (NAD(P)+)